MRKVFRFVDSVNEFVGEKLKFVVLFMILVIIAEVFMRYVLNKPTVELPVIQIWTGTTLYVLAFGYALLKKAHVRVDVLYSRYSDRWKAIVDSVLWFVFFLPAVGLILYTGFNWVEYALRIGERSNLTFWYPPTAPIRIIFLVGMSLFFLQGVVTLIRDLYMAVRNKPYD